MSFLYTAWVCLYGVIFRHINKYTSVSFHIFTHTIHYPFTYCRRDVILFTNSCSNIPPVKIRGPTKLPPTVETLSLQCPQRPSTTSIQPNFARFNVSTAIKQISTKKQNESVVSFFIMNSNKASKHKIKSCFTKNCRTLCETPVS
jgi:hypothetical protein